MNIYLNLNGWDCLTICVLAALVLFTLLGVNASNNERRVKIAETQALVEGVVLDEPDERVTLTEAVRDEPGTGRHRLAEDRAAAVAALSKRLYTPEGEKKGTPDSSLHLLPVKPLVKEPKRKGRGPLVSLSSGEVFDDEDPQEGVNQKGRWADED